MDINILKMNLLLEYNIQPLMAVTLYYLSL